MRASAVTRTLSALFAAGILSCLPLQPALAHGETSSARPAGTAAATPLIEGLFALNFPVSTDSREAQAYFNQALVLTYGFDHAAAEVSFLEAARLDHSSRGGSPASSTAAAPR